VQYKGTQDQRKVVWKEQVQGGNFNVVLTTYEIVMRDKGKLGSLQWRYIIVDEGHRLKNAQAKFTQLLGAEYSAQNRLLLTGTPLQNSLPELWSLLNFLLPKVFGSVEDFESWFAKPFAAYSGKQTGPQAAGAEQEKESETDLTQEEKMLVIHRLHAVLRPFLLRRTKAEVLSQLPEKIERVVRCELSAWQRELYTQIQKFGCVAQEPGSKFGSDRGSRGVSNLIMQLRKACNHPYLFRDDEAPPGGVDDEIWRSSGKFELLDRILPKLFRGGHRVLLFSQMTSLLNILEDYLEYRGLAFLRLDGSTSAQEREERMVQFNAPDSPFFIFLLSTRAGGLGINLVSADTVIIFDSDWNPTADAQAQDRAHRIGQLREVRVFRLITTTPVEERILSRASDKAAMGALVIGAGKFEGTGGDDEDDVRKSILQDLLREDLDAGKVEGEDEEGGGAGGPRRVVDSVLPDDECINQYMARDEDEFAFFQRLDLERVQAERERGCAWAQAAPGAAAHSLVSPLAEDEGGEEAPASSGRVRIKAAQSRSARPSTRASVRPPRTCCKATRETRTARPRWLPPPRARAC
jgi:ATP-dependent helicase STH1/SNF2